jgi:pantoate--beta-alanine ligase
MGTRPIEVITEPAALGARCDAARREGRTVALVPTMGALHEGHLALVDEAARHGDLVVVTIFVNPTQFGPGEDLDRYPRDLAGDLARLAPRGAHVVFAPAREAMYPPGHRTSVRVAGLTEGLCGAHRPGHFDGVATIVAKLFALAGPCAAVFGRKDYQQLRVIRRMAADLDLPVEIVGLPTVREPDGLALSSRNAFLSVDDRRRALSLAAGLAAAHRAWASGERSVGVLRRAAEAPVRRAADSVDYVAAADPDDLGTLDDGERAAGRLLIAVAARLGATRLIDNTVLGEDRPPPVATEGG